MTGRVFKAIFAAAASVLLASLIIIIGVMYDYSGNIQKNQLYDELELASVSVEESGTDYLKNIKSSNYRITWIASDGFVIYDTVTGAESLENHSDREEVKQALKDGKGESKRYSSTIMEQTVYCAKRLTDGSVLRISQSYASVALLFIGMLRPIFVVLFVAIILSVVLAHRIAKRVTEPLNNLDLENPLENDTYEEIAPLLNKIDRQNRKIKNQLRSLQQKTDEFTQITENMSEGLILIDDKEIVLSINPAAQRVFASDENVVGNDFLNLDRSHDVVMAIHNAFRDGHCEVQIERAGRKYQIDITRIETAGKVFGAVILMFDITEKEFAERNRREFTANVSHELKTPLQGIIGSAELIEKGLVKPEDLPHFVGLIRKEAQRLVILIEDIIRLSQLDEGNEMPTQDVDLLDLAEEVRTNLKETAAKKDVKISLSGNGAVVHGVQRLLYETVYNLCDNAIKYNVDGGTVDIVVESDKEKATVTVRDSGIGIAPEYQSRVFERFYRVDKSHSKASGGTGLGLSIVKHAVLYHHGKISLTSEPGKGTEISVSFPLNK